VVGRGSKGLHREVWDSAGRKSAEGLLGQASPEGATSYTDASTAYPGGAGRGRGHAPVCHRAREWARDDDGDGVREVHNNTMEGLGVGLRNFRRPWRGVSKYYLDQYVALFQWGFLLKVGSRDLVRALGGLQPLTNFAP
jgi:hypothetical protein